MNEDIEKIESLQGEITALKSLLGDSDYAFFRVIEDLTDCDNVLDMVQVFRSFLADYGELVKNRRTWREKINALESELNVLEKENNI